MNEVIKTEQRKAWITKMTQGKAMNIYRHRYGGIDFYSWRIVKEVKPTIKINYYQAYIEGCDFDDREFSSYEELNTFVSSFIDCFVPKAAQEGKIKNDLKAMLKAALVILEQDEEAVIHDYGQSSLEIVEEMMNKIEILFYRRS